MIYLVVSSSVEIFELYLSSEVLRCNLLYRPPVSVAEYASNYHPLRSKVR